MMYTRSYPFSVWIFLTVEDMHLNTLEYTHIRTHVYILVKCEHHYSVSLFQALCLHVKSVTICIQQNVHWNKLKKDLYVCLTGKKTYREDLIQQL